MNARVDSASATGRRRPRCARLAVVLFALLQVTSSRLDAQPQRLLAVTDVGQMRLTISNAGTFGTSFQSRDTPSMEWPTRSGIDHLVRGSLWVGGIDAATGDTLVTIGGGDAYYLDVIFQHSEFTPASGRPQEFSRDPASPYYRPGTVADENFHSVFVDSLPVVKDRSEEPHRPLGIRVIEETYSWASDPLDDPVIVEFNIVNTGQWSLQDVWVGIYSEMVTNNRLGSWPAWPPGARWFDFQDPHWNAGQRLWWNHNVENRFVSPDVRCGIQVVGSGGSGTSGRGPDSLQTKRISLSAWNWSAAGFQTWTDETLYARMSTGTVANLDSLFDPGTVTEPVGVLAVGPFGMLAPGDTVQVVFAFVPGADAIDLERNAHWVQLAYDSRYNLVPTPVAIEDFEATASPNSVRLDWRLSEAAVGQVLRIAVERADSRLGPFGEASGWLEPTPDMQYVDSRVEAERTYWYRLVLRMRDGSESAVGPVSAMVSQRASRTILYTPIVVSDDGPVRIRYGIGPTRTATRLDIYTVGGRRLRSLAPGVLEPGDHVSVWDRRDENGNRVVRGVYLIRLETQGARATAKFALLTP